jgi:hypothetical protein
LGNKYVATLEVTILAKYPRDNDPWKSQGFTDAEVDAVRFLLKQKRRELTRSLGEGISKENRVGRKRFVDGQVRELMKQFRGPKNRRPSIKLLVTKYKDSSLLNGLLPNRADIWQEVSKRRNNKPVVIDAREFSFVSNPIGTIKVLAEVAAAECSALDATVNFLDEVCLDIGPYVVLQAMWKEMAPVFRGGAISKGLQSVVDAVGLREEMNMKAFKRPSSGGRLTPFRLRQRRAAGTSASVSRHIDVQSREVVADDLVSWFNNWLSNLVNQQLNREGGRIVRKIVGEVLDNAERHGHQSDNDGDWAIAGCLRQLDAPNETEYWCHLSFLSLGNTIEESMRTCDPQIRASIDKYVMLHQNCRELNSEALTVVFALQDGITRVPEAFNSNRGGTGLLDILEFFSGIGGTFSERMDPRLAIISGNTCILACGDYICGLRKSGEDKLSNRQLWFNPENSSHVEPSKNHVLVIPNRLQGTLVTMSFPLDMDYLEKTVKNSNDQN